MSAPEQPVARKKWSLRNAALWGFGLTVVVLVINIAISNPDTIKWLNAFDDELFFYHWAGYFLVMPILFVAIASIRNLFVKNSK
jgi:hypothetical protein